MLSIHAASVLLGTTPTAAVASEVDVSLPYPFVPVTTTRMCLLTSSPTRSYVESVAPSMSEQFPASELLGHERHWYVSVGAG